MCTHTQACQDSRSGQALSKAVALNPQDAIAQYRLGQLYLQDGDAVKAIRHFKIALRGHPDDIATLYNLDRALHKAGRLEEAHPIEKQLAESRERTDRASTVAVAASRLNSEGIELEKSGDIRAALAKYRAALDLDPTGFGFELNYGLALCRLGALERRSCGAARSVATRSRQCRCRQSLIYSDGPAKRAARSSSQTSLNPSIRRSTLGFGE
jgi:tetratricopeptide (TPR) repeat protein